MQPTLGQVDDDLHEAKRDAVHVAITPAIAGEHLVVGLKVRLGKDGLIYRTKLCGDSDYIGVVDPFINGAAIERGTLFWLILKPGIAKNLRHEWECAELSQIKSTTGEEKDKDEDDYIDDGCQGCQ